MNRHTMHLVGDTLADLERVCAQMRLLGAPNDAAIQVRVKASLSGNGGRPSTVTAQWDDQPTGEKIVPAVPPPVSQR